jgi:hypothetical protein
LSLERVRRALKVIESRTNGDKSGICFQIYRRQAHCIVSAGAILHRRPHQAFRKRSRANAAQAVCDSGKLHVLCDMGLILGTKVTNHSNVLRHKLPFSTLFECHRIIRIN